MAGVALALVAVLATLWPRVVATPSAILALWIGVALIGRSTHGHQLSPSLLSYFNVRWIGGGAEGTGEVEDFGDGYTENWLHFLTVSIGVELELR